jgi:hypothetical protein
MIQEPNETQNGIFTVKVLPNSGTDPAYCYVILRVEYGATEQDTKYVIDPNEADQLTNEQVEELI